MVLRHGSLFSGIGGFDLAAEWMGWENVFHCEWNDFGRKILNYYWPKAFSYHDIKETDFTKHAGEIDVLTGGFPCQPYSHAGSRKGKEDDRHLWPEMLRAIGEIKPRWIVGENVFGIVNWNEGMVFEEVQLEMENQGYETTSFVLPACAVGAPHRRDRVWFVAYSNRSSTRSPREGCSPEKERSKIHEQQIEWREPTKFDFRRSNVLRPNTNTNDKRLQRCKDKRSIEECRAQPKKQLARFFQPGWKNFPIETPVLSGNDGFPSELDGITFPRWRKESIKAYGNAVVPQLVLQIFKAIEEFEMLINQS